MGRPCISNAIKRSRLRAMDSAIDAGMAGHLRPAALAALTEQPAQKAKSVPAASKKKAKAKAKR